MGVPRAVTATEIHTNFIQAVAQHHTGLVYEWFEWAIALLLCADAAEAYNGQLGDPWDAHADMLMATIGALCAWPFLDHATTAVPAMDNAVPLPRHRPVARTC